MAPEQGKPRKRRRLILDESDQTDSDSDDHEESEEEDPRRSPRSRGVTGVDSTGFSVQSPKPLDVLACAGCNSKAHRLSLCIQVKPGNGLMEGCPLCNTLQHSLTNCPKTKDDVKMQLKIIETRANMPSFQPTQEWAGVVRATVASGHNPPDGFPWTAEFTKKLRGVMGPFQRDLDIVGLNINVALPIDPDTKDWETIQQKFPPSQGG